MGQNKSSGPARRAGRTMPHIHETASPSMCTHDPSLVLERFLGLQNKVLKSYRTGSPCTPSHPKTSLPPATGLSYRKWDLFTKLAFLGLLSQVLYIELRSTNRAGSQMLQGQNIGQGWILQPRQDESCRYKYKINHVTPVTCVGLSHSLCSSVGPPSPASCSPHQILLSCTSSS